MLKQIEEEKNKVVNDETKSKSSKLDFQNVLDKKNDDYENFEKFDLGNQRNDYENYENINVPNQDINNETQTELEGAVGGIDPTTNLDNEKLSEIEKPAENVDLTLTPTNKCSFPTKNLKNFFI